MIVAGTVTKKMAPQVVRLYNQMSEPKYGIGIDLIVSLHQLVSNAIVLEHKTNDWNNRNE